MSSDAPRQVILLSGGLDSTVCAALAARTGADHLGLTFDYGQRHRREIDAATDVAAHFGFELVLAKLNAREWGGSALTDDSIAVPTGMDPDAASGSIPATYVPARNLVFLSVAVGVAEARGAGAVTIGVNAVDYSGYPDCRPEFIEAFSRAAALALKRGVEGDPVDVLTPLINMTKAEIVALGSDCKAPFELTWSCYLGGENPCGDCDSCRLRSRGFQGAGLVDPTLDV